ncbi:Alpha/Beta hydrolase protein [Aspergillus californicus]
MLGLIIEGNKKESLLKLAHRILERVSTVVMTLTVYLISFALSFTITRLVLNAVLIPLYLYKLGLSMLPSIAKNAFKLLTPGGRSRLIQDADLHRSRAATLANRQLNGIYQFKPDEFFHVQRDGPGWMQELPWSNDTHEFKVCGATVRYIHLKPSYSDILQDGARNHKPVIFLHGNPSWSYMWRNVFPSLLERGHEVYAIDWLGHGRSDKILKPESITFELHTRTLVQFFEETGLEHVMIAAHDWGGCVALCTLPKLQKSTCDSLFLLNSFFPPRMPDATLHYRLLDRVWYCTTALFGGYIPPSAIMRVISPSLSKADAEAYSAPYEGLPRSAKSSITRFSHIAPNMPRFIHYRLRQFRVWKILEGLCGPAHFNTLTTQTRLAAEDDQIRGYWAAKDADAQPSLNRGTKIAVVFGHRDPLVREYRKVLVKVINPDLMVDWAPRGLWIPGAGRMPVEGKAAGVGGFIVRFAGAEQS